MQNLLIRTAVSVPLLLISLCTALADQEQGKKFTSVDLGVKDAVIRYIRGRTDPQVLIRIDQPRLKITLTKLLLQPGVKSILSVDDIAKVLDDANLESRVEQSLTLKSILNEHSNRQTPKELIAFKSKDGLVNVAAKIDKIKDPEYARNPFKPWARIEVRLDLDRYLQLALGEARFSEIVAVIQENEALSKSSKGTGGTTLSQENLTKVEDFNLLKGSFGVQEALPFKFGVFLHKHPSTDHEYVAVTDRQSYELSSTFAVESKDLIRVKYDNGNPVVDPKTNNYVKDKADSTLLSFAYKQAHVWMPQFIYGLFSQPTANLSISSTLASQPLDARSKTEIGLTGLSSEKTLVNAITVARLGIRTSQSLAQTDFTYRGAFRFFDLRTGPGRTGYLREHYIDAKAAEAFYIEVGAEVGYSLPKKLDRVFLVDGPGHEEKRSRLYGRPFIYGQIMPLKFNGLPGWGVELSGTIWYLPDRFQTSASNLRFAEAGEANLVFEEGAAKFKLGVKGGRNDALGFQRVAPTYQLSYSKKM